MEGQEPASLAENTKFAEFGSVEVCKTVPELDDSQLIGVPVAVAGSDDVSVGVSGQMTNMETEIEVKVEENSGVKRKRGRPPRVQGKPQPKPPPRMKNEEEDVCFICFDGGNLVLCDRRGCPKAYHPACIKRDEAFFRSKAKWNCGWHICSNCEKASLYMCYTCTYSLCKGCIKDVDIFCVRGNKGLCPTCMRTVMLIENSEQGNKDMIQVDFDDQSSWEYLFKMYWIYLKTKLALTLDELIKAKNPGKGAALISRKSDSSNDLYDNSDEKSSSSDGISGNLEGKASRRKMTKKDPNLDNKGGPQTCTEKALDFPGGAEWASKELLEFVAHMKNGDTSVLSQFDVQALLLEYIKRNNLRDPRRKSQIICDLRLGNMFGKARVGHFEMLKLLELHFLIKDDSHADSIIQGGFIGPVASQFEVDGAIGNQTMTSKDKRRKTRKRGDDRGPQTNLDEYAAIDFHNINLIYLRRSLMENLIEDSEKFHDKVVGSVVRIRISSSDQKQDMYRLVQVVGTSRASVPYKVGQRTANVVLEILNLNKKESISIDEISNQEFSKDECGRLRQSIKCGLVKRFRVGEILEKAVALQAVRVNDWIEAETLRLNHLRDRASEKGHRKELRECVEKLQLLNTPEEHQRRQHEIPKVHADPQMDPSYESDDAGEPDLMKKVDKSMRYHGSCEKGRKPISQRRGGDISNSNNSKARRNSVILSEQNRNMSTTLYPEKEGVARLHEGENGSLVRLGGDTHGSNNWEKPRNLINPAGSASGAWNDRANVRSKLSSGGVPETSTVPFSADMSPSANNSEIERLWHYQDPAGKIQGPFSMLQLRKWSTSGYFPPDLRIWKIYEKQDDATLLTDAMNGHYLEESQSMYSGNDATAQNSCSSSCIAPADVNASDGVGKISQGRESARGSETRSDTSQSHSSLPSPTFPGKLSGITSHQGREGDSGEQWCSGQDQGDWNPDRITVFQSNSGLSYEKCSNSQSNVGQSKPPQVNCPSNGCNSDAYCVPLVKSTDMPEQNHEVDFPNLPSPTPKSSDEDLKHDTAENKQSASSNDAVPDSGPSWSSGSSLVGGGGAQLPEVADEWNGYSPTPVKTSVEEWDSNPILGSSFKPTEVGSNIAATPTSKGDEMVHSSPSHPASNISDWQAIIAGDNEFPLAEESVSDLLAEVDALESLNGPPSPTSAMNSNIELAQISKDDCFSSVEVLSPMRGPVKSDALSSTSDILMPCQSGKDRPNTGFQADVLDPQKRSAGHSSSSTSAEAEGETKPIEVSVKQWESGSDIQPSASSSASWDLPATDSAWRAGPENSDTAWGPLQHNASLGWGGPVQININMGWGNAQGTPQGNPSINWGNSAGNMGMWINHPKYGGERFPGRGFQGAGSGYGRERSSWNRQSSFGGGGGSGGSGGGGGSYRPPPKGQRVCKFYESGRCKKGAFCDYLHP